MLAGWSAQFTASYTNAHFDDALIPCNDYNGDGTPDTNGIPAVQAGRYYSRCTSHASLGALPKLQISANSEYGAKLTQNVRGYVRALVNYAPSAHDPNDGRTVPSTFRTDMFAGLAFEGSFKGSIELFARNLFNERTRLSSGGAIFDLFGSPTGYSPVSIRRPREIGFVTRFDF